MSKRTFERDGSTRTVETAAEAVSLTWDGWREIPNGPKARAEAEQAAHEPTAAPEPAVSTQKATTQRG